MSRDLRGPVSAAVLAGAVAVLLLLVGLLARGSAPAVGHEPKPIPVPVYSRQ